MSAVPLFRDTNMAAATSRENTLRSETDKPYNNNNNNNHHHHHHHYHHPHDKNNNDDKLLPER